ncbi:uncharacterized protein C22orf15 [Boleophthalmus pectinirostris]|uniref:uncharacterized protein C22orf15 n=1 Tax=Boleophthalmus pectinirostris TaxID=150288 RepID=UPI002431B08C|nr:uncharacterized protein C22orf15 [Boleophthalmus pectinirostris]
MFVTVLFGDDRMELFNPDCKLIHFIHDLKLRCGLDSEDHVDLMDSRGTVMKLEGREQSLDRANALLKDRHKYILVRVCRVDGECKYVPLLTKTQRQPEFTELLRKLSTGQKRLGRRGQRHGSLKPRNRSKNNKLCFLK